MARLNKQELEELRDLMMTEPGIHQLITNKENALEDLAPNKNTEFQILTDAPAPLMQQWAKSVDRLQKDHAFQRHQEREKTQSKFDKRIDQRARENVEIFGTGYQAQNLESLDKDQIVALAEKGADEVLKMDREKQREIEKEPEPEKDIIVDIDETLKLSLEETEKLMEREEFLTDRYEDNAKDMDLYKSSPDPANDYE